MLVGVAGGTIGVLIPFGAIRLLQWMQPAQLPRLDAVTVDLPVLMFAAAVALLTSSGGRFRPAFLATNTDAMLAMRSGIARNRGTMARARLRSALVVAEIAASIVLLVGAGLLARSLAALSTPTSASTPRT